MLWLHLLKMSHYLDPFFAWPTPTVHCIGGPMTQSILEYAIRDIFLDRGAYYQPEGPPKYVNGAAVS